MCFVPSMTHHASLYRDSRDESFATQSTVIWILPSITFHVSHWLVWILSSKTLYESI